MPIASEVWEDIEWEKKNPELQKRYKDQWIAIVGKKVVSYGKKLSEVKEQARKLTGKKEVYTLFIESVELLKDTRLRRIAKAILHNEIQDKEWLDRRESISAEI